MSKCNWVSCIYKSLLPDVSWKELGRQGADIDQLLTYKEDIWLGRRYAVGMFMDTKSLSSKQVRWAQKLSQYHFQIDYRQGKANGAADALFRYLQQSAEEEETLRAENVKILHRLQSSLAKVSSLSTSHPSPLYQILICGTTALPQLHQFWDSLRSEIARDSPYVANIGGMRLRLPKLQDNDEEAKTLRSAAAGLPEG